MCLGVPSGRGWGSAEDVLAMESVCNGENVLMMVGFGGEPRPGDCLLVRTHRRFSMLMRMTTACGVTELLYAQGLHCDEARNDV